MVNNMRICIYLFIFSHGVCYSQVAVYYNEARMAREGRDVRESTPPSIQTSLRCVGRFTGGYV